MLAQQCMFKLTHLTLFPEQYKLSIISLLVRTKQVQHNVQFTKIGKLMQTITIFS